MNNSRYHRTVDSIVNAYGRFHRPEYLGMDPLVTVRRYTDPADREMGGFLAAALSYGRVETIIRNVEALFTRMEGRPAEFVLTTDLSTKRKTLRGFRHRFNDGDDIALLLQSIAAIAGARGSMEPFFRNALDSSAGAMRGALTLFSDAVRGRAAELSGAAPLPGSFPFLVPSPSAGCACKRLNMFLRWMARPDDGIDLGQWRSVAPAELIIPVDTHIAKIARTLKMTDRTSADWRMAEQITGFLRRIDPFDPVRFDFSLCRRGMIDVRKDAA